MSGQLAQVLGDALNSMGHASIGRAFMGHAVESTSGERQERSELTALAERVAGTLAARGVGPGETVHVRIGNRPSDLGTLLGIWRSGAVAVPVHVAAAASTVERLQRRTRSRFAIDGDRLDVIARLAPPERALLCGAALVIFTSGSTGEPKNVVIGHSEFADKLAVLDRLLGLRTDDTVLLPLQLTFIFGLWVSLLALTKSARLVLVPRFSRDVIARSLAGVTVLAGVPSMFRALLADPAPSAPDLRVLLTGGEVLSPKLADAMQRFGHAAIYDLYGLTETGSCDFCSAHVPATACPGRDPAWVPVRRQGHAPTIEGPADQPDGFGAIGKPTEHVRFRIAQDGELQICTPFGMLGYLDDPELTQASFADGYFKTGDLARLTADGNVTLVGRSKDIVSRGGHKIAPLEIDNLLGEHPDVAAALCAGVPNERLGEVIHAVVVRRAGSGLDAAALRDWLLARTERFKVPDVFHFRDALPVGSTGKADRRAVATLAASEVGGDAALLQSVSAELRPPP